MNNWRAFGVETVAAVLDAKSFSGLSKSVTVRPTEAAVLIKDGAVVDIFSEGRRSTRSSVEILKSIVGIKSSVEVFIADTTPFNLEFWLEDPSSPASVAERVSFGISALSKDGKAISAQITIRLSVEYEQIDIFYRITKGRQVLSRDDVATEIRDELLGKVIGLELAKHNLDDLRGNRELLEDVQKTLERELLSTLHGYGLKLNNFYINWGLTSQQLQAFGKARHDAAIEAIRRQQELAEIEAVQGQQELAEVKGQPNIEAPDSERTSPRSSWFLAIPITSLIWGLLWLGMILDDSGWDDGSDMGIGFLIMLGIPTFVLSILPIKKIFEAKSWRESALYLPASTLEQRS